MATDIAVKNEEIVYLEEAALVPHPQNPRGALTEEDLAELERSIERHGQRQPCVVRPMRQHTVGLIEPRADGAGMVAGRFYEILLGHRRAAVCKRLGRKVACVVVELEDDVALALMLTDHETHRPPDPLLESDAIAAFLARPGWSIESVADAFGKSVRWVAQRANLRTLSASVRELRKDPLSPVAIWPVSWLEDFARLAPEQQDELAMDRLEDVVTKEQLDELLAAKFHVLGKAPWDVADATLVPAAGACTACPKTSLRSPGLFDDDLEDQDVARARCRDAGCWKRKHEAHVLVQITKVREKEPKALLLRGDWGGDSQQLGLPEGEVVLDGWQFTKAKKGDRGAVPAVVATGKGAGSTTYVIPTTDRARKAVDRATPAEEQTPRAKLAQSRARTDARRRAFVVDAIAARIAKMKPPPQGDVARLVACFDLSPLGVFGSEKKRRSLYDAAGEREAWVASTWKRLVPEIARALRRAGPSTLDADYAQARWLGGILGLPLDSLEADALKEIPDPTWWPAKAERPRKAGRKARVDEEETADVGA